MNVIDALFITLGLDTKDYEKKRQEVTTSLKKFGEASDKQTKLIAESGKKAAQSFSALKIEILGALAAFGMGAGFKDFIQSSMNMQAAAGRQAAALGVSANSLQVWKQMAVNMGESGDAAVATLQKVSEGMAKAKRGDTSFLTAGSQYGVVLNVKDNVEQVLSKLNEKAHAIKQKYGVAQAISFLSQYGIHNLGMETLLMKSQSDLANFRADATKHAIQLTQQEIEQNQKLQQQLGDLLGDFGKIKVELENKLLPVVIKLGNEFEKWLDGVDWDKVVADIGKIADKVQSLIGALGGVKGILIEIAAIKVLGWMGSIAGWVIQLRALTVALGAARAAAAAGGAAGAAAAAGGAAESVGGAGLAAGAARLVSSWALPVWALFHSESTGGKRRADGTYEDEFDWNSPAAQAAIAKQKAQSQKKTAQLFSSLESKYGLPKGMLDSVYNAESSRGKNMLSPKGAMGPFQFMPATAAQYGLRGSSVYDTGKSASAAARYLHDLIAQFHGNVREAIAAYNWGSGNVLNHGMNALPKETRDYLAKVTAGMAPAGARTAAAGSTNTNNVTINGPINVQTKATDANGVAKGMQKAFRSNPLIQGSVTAAS